MENIKANDIRETYHDRLRQTVEVRVMEKIDTSKYDSKFQKKIAEGGGLYKVMINKPDINTIQDAVFLVYGADLKHPVDKDRVNTSGNEG